uniref:Peptide-O-fucosyltransferase n=1 Tax=Attheya septentrionalis TaxID=420275 RepID=A0A7S2XLN4_9STRA|mmetsp:Transcript_19055/g.34556  ORF Transcript_19055/g.34556 Transcript_19055/m.34556 type:complete len:419 (+) Transcript_19055:800-2056(+)
MTVSRNRPHTSKRSNRTSFLGCVAVSLIFCWVFVSLWVNWKATSPITNNYYEPRWKRGINFSQTTPEHDGETTHLQIPDWTRNTSYFCVSWDINMDGWWTHQPDWFVVKENQTDICFEQRSDRKAQVYKQLHAIQYASCHNTVTKYMWSSGWAADLTNVVDGLYFALQEDAPFQVRISPMDKGWHYASKKDGSRPVCPTKDMYCYFLNLTHCPPQNRVHTKTLTSIESRTSVVPPQWIRQYATRPQQWLRREIYEYLHSPTIVPDLGKSRCAVMHVRRSDVVLHKGITPRRYHNISEYVDAMLAKFNDPDDRSEDVSNLGMPSTILLLTDDQNAIEEALTQYPKYHWVYMNRSRHRGAEGGFENHIPSDDPKQEVVVLLSTSQLVQHCDTLVHGKSGFSDLLSDEMDQSALRINIDKN